MAMLLIGFLCCCLDVVHGGAKSRSYFGGGTGHTWLDEVVCQGNVSVLHLAM